MPSTNATDRPHLAVLYRSGEMRVWDIKSGQVVLTVPITKPGMDADGSEFICMAAPHTNTSGDVVAIGGVDQLILSPCKPPAPEEGPKKLAQNSVRFI